MDYRIRTTTTTTSGGLGIGSVIAGIMSWSTFHSVGWCILHVILGWFYVIYWLIFYW